ncbi:MAG TPA: rhomboid family intramembrane serine protease [Deltaproteobacteria bacterium]|nr:MAG: rhomboid family intramembrane serine protease [Deltaproteobacteria bacterium GWA2_55_82]OGQ64501.1 MAG: rhomboid family intramembrane serine protease [Deltaproteobacteria bacterium RIFCSPLOWO2_02_FULL_55_12]OIJ73626.1 MAG: rhomboid family intramembrane serine protease [Deltaproteobacteria bacterium GWC2_55_46]HBG47764.1 rhomboid family intramembrane serine protease [Deltaproteobacteria bacterium]HCY12014.1 rhomboid family intramembrane serine protease [Deltaproteobacteria bacterium]
MIPIKDNIPSSTYPYVTVALVAVNVAVFIFELTLGAGVERFIYKTAAIPLEITTLSDIGPKGLIPVPLTIFTAMFVHGGVLHVGGNMLFLWIFGDNVEDRFGHVRFLIFYLAAGVAASMTHIAIEPGSTMPMVGASGAIAGVLGAYFLMYPRAQVNTLVILPLFIGMTRLPAVIFLGVWFLFQVLSSGVGAQGGVAWFAHIGGFITGVAVAFFYKVFARAM